MPLNISFEDVAIAYRKVKYDIFNDSNYMMAWPFVLFERNLYENLKRLHSKLLNEEDEFTNGRELTGSHAWVLKKVEPKSITKNKLDNEKYFIYRSNRIKEWNNNDIAYDSHFRFIGQLPVEFHIIGALWIDKIGHKLETSVGECSYGCRLKRPRQTKNKFIPEFNSYEEIKPSKSQNGHFRFYPPDYRRWQKDGLSAIKENLQKNKQIVAITADVESFYHRISADFLLHNDFIQETGISQYSKTELHLTKVLLNLIKCWGANVQKDFNDQLKLKFPLSGIPVGWAPSKVIANLLLSCFDTAVKKGLTPLFYGRYVDDIFLVLEDNGMMNTKDEIWSFIESHVKDLYYNRDSNDDAERKAAYYHPWSGESIIKFGHEKEKIFILEGTSGETLVEKVEQALDENSSEWRLLPESEEEIIDMADGMSSSTSDFSEAVNSLRKSDGISIERLKFVLLIRRFETMIDTLPMKIWQKGLQNFFSFCKDFVLVPEQLPLFCAYHPRLMSLLSRAKMYTEALEMWNQVTECWDVLRRKDIESSKYLNKAEYFHSETLKESFLRGFDLATPPDRTALQSIIEIFGFDELELEVRPQAIFLTDFHIIPYKQALLNKKYKKPFLLGPRPLGYKKVEEEMYNELDSLPIKEIQSFWEKQIKKNDEIASNNSFPLALLFTTRPFSIFDLTILTPKWSANGSNFKQFTKYLHAFGLKLPIIPPIEINKNLTKLTFNDIADVRDPVVALTSFLVNNESWKALVRQDGYDPDSSRIPRLFELVNNILKCKQKIDYVVFPELSIPRSVINLIANRLGSKGISLITGAEYLFKRSLNNQIRGYVKNQLLYFLQVNGKQTVRVTQEKTIPAIHEEHDLFQVGGLLLKADDPTKYIIEHRGFVFSGLICNDFLNIDNRQQLRGKIDALVVIEWNQDTNTYDSLVQSSSSDLHCFVLQVNNREYGDTRLRGPYKEPYKRDRVTIRGGIHDYFVLTNIEVEKLRDFQKFFRSPSGPFKPVPAGFQMSSERK